MAEESKSGAVFWKTIAAGAIVALIVPGISSYVGGLISSSNIARQQEAMVKQQEAQEKANAERFEQQEQSYKERFDQQERSYKERFDRMESGFTAQVTQLNLANDARNAALSARLNAYEERMSKIDAFAAQTAERIANLATNMDQRGSQRDRQLDAILTRLSRVESNQQDDRLASARTSVLVERMADALGVGEVRGPAKQR